MSHMDLWDSPWLSHLFFYFSAVLLDHLRRELLTMTILTGLFMLLFFMHALAVLFALLIFFLMLLISK